MVLPVHRLRHVRCRRTGDRCTGP